MKVSKILFTLLMVMVTLGVFAQKSKSEKHVRVTNVYAVGVASSFNDSLAYITEMQVLDKVTLDHKAYLHRRSGYSFQLRDYLSGQGKMNYTCIILFNEKKSMLEKELTKVKSRFAKSGVSLTEIKEQDFKFTRPEEL